MHIPVLQKEVIQFLEPKPNENFIDCTIGEAGHTAAILERNKPDGKVLGIEIDPELYKKLKSRMAEFSIFPDFIEDPRWQSHRDNFQFSNRLVLANDSYANLKRIVEREKFGKVSGILFDLGMSSWHLEKSGRGFSFQRNERLDMRYQGLERDRRGTGEGQSPKNPQKTAEEIVNNWAEKDIEKILMEYGEERFAKRIAKKISEERKVKTIKTTFQLVEVIKRAVPVWEQKKKRHFAAKTFQALRIAVNDELNNLKKALPQALELLKPGGRLVAISFHSLEDRIVKHFFHKYSPFACKILTKKPLLPSKEETKINPRSRSAKLRAAVKQ